MASTPRVSSSWASTKARFGKNGAPRARRRMAKRRAGAAGACLLPRRSGAAGAEIATCAALAPPCVMVFRCPKGYVKLCCEPAS